MTPYPVEQELNIVAEHVRDTAKAIGRLLDVIDHVFDVAAHSGSFVVLTRKIGFVDSACSPRAPARFAEW